MIYVGLIGKAENHNIKLATEMARLLETLGYKTLIVADPTDYEALTHNYLDENPETDG